jgi:hypothetical protein
MTGVEHRCRLVGLFQQLATVQRRLGDERVVIVRTEDSRRLQGTDDRCDGLELRPALRYALLVDDERLDVEFVCELLEVAFVCNLSGEKEQAQARVRCFDLVIQDADYLVNKLEQAADFGFPFGFL